MTFCRRHLKGIGAAKAKAIIEYREAQPFETIEDVMKVSGIGEKTYEDATDSIVVEVTEEQARVTKE